MKKRLLHVKSGSGSYQVCVYREPGSIHWHYAATLKIARRIAEEWLKQDSTVVSCTIHKAIEVFKREV